MECPVVGSCHSVFPVGCAASEPHSCSGGSPLAYKFSGMQCPSHCRSGEVFPVFQSLPLPALTSRGVTSDRGELLGLPAWDVKK